MMQNRYKTRTDTSVMIHREYIIIYDEDDGVGTYIYTYYILLSSRARGHYRARSLTDDGLRRDLR